MTDIEGALQTLDKHADNVVTSTASAVFLSTAVLQSGRLDVLVVFAAQTRLALQFTGRQPSFENEPGVIDLGSPETRQDSVDKVPLQALQSCHHQ
jgi:hypothetical protein